MAGIVGGVLLVIALASFVIASRVPPQRRHDARAQAWFLAGLLSFVLSVFVLTFPGLVP